MSRRKRSRWRPDRSTSAPTPAATAVDESPRPPDPPGDAPAEPSPAQTQAPADPPPADTTGKRRSWRELGLVLLLRAAHPRQALITAAGVTAAGALSDRPPRELGLIFGTVLVGQAVVGWHHELVDRKRDAANEVPGKPLAAGQLDPGSVWFLLTCAVLVVIPLSVANGLTAGIAYLVVVALSLLGNLLFRRGLLSWLTWAASFALYPAFLSYGGWASSADGNPPEITMTVLAGVLGICVHFLRALPGLVADNRDGRRHLPLRVALRLGAPRLLWISIALTVLAVAALVVEGSRVGLAQ